MLIEVAARSRAWVYGRLLADIAGSNPAGGIDVLRLVSVCVSIMCWQGECSLRGADHSSERVLPSVCVCVCVCV